MRTLRVILIAVLLIATPAARATDGYYRLSDASVQSVRSDNEVLGKWAPTIGTPEYRVISQALGIDGSPEGDMAGELFASYTLEHLEMWTELAESMQSLESVMRYDDSDDAYSGEQEQRAASARTIRERDTEITDRFIRDLRLVLGDVEESKWSRVEAFLGRRSELTQGGIGLDRTDLVRPLLSLDLSAAQRESLGPELDAYHAAMTEAFEQRRPVFESLDERVSRYRGTRAEWRGLRRTGTTEQRARARDDLDDARDDVVRVARRARDASRLVSDVNVDFVARFSELLDPEQRETLNALLDGDDRRTHLPDQLRNTYTYWVANALSNEGIGALYPSSSRAQRLNAIAPEPLSPEQSEAIDALTEELERELESLREDLPDSLRAEEAQFRLSFEIRTERSRVEIRFVPDTESFEDDEREGERVARYLRRFAEIDDDFLERLRDLLTVRQRAYAVTY